MITQTKSIMTPKVYSVPLGTTLFDASRLMTEKRIRHLPVFNFQDEVVGIISQRDLQYVPDSKNIPVELIMKTSLEYVRMETPLRQAIFKMLEKKISSLLVTGEDSEIIGIVTTDDILWHLARILAHEKDEKDVFTAMTDLQTIGEIANSAANVGI